MSKPRLFPLFIALLLALSALSLPAAAEETVDVSALYKNKDVDAAWSASQARAIDLSALQTDVLTIAEQGDYVLSGAWNGQIIVELPEEEKARLILNGVDIVSPAGPAIYEKQADKLIITLAEGAQNILTDGAALFDGDDTIGAALYAEDDLSINGSGALIAHGTAKHGIQSKADLIIADGRITVDAAGDGIRGRNSVLVLGGSLTVTAQGDGIVSTREDKEGKGWVVIADGEISVTTGSGAGAQAAASARGNRGGRGQFAPSVTANAASQKGVKAAVDLTVLGGDLTLNCADDGLHAANVTVLGGSLSIRTGDDGLHADSQATVSGGVIDIAQCYEGIEGGSVTIAGGDIRIVASDDGVNAAGGSDNSGFGGRGGDHFGGSGSMLAVSGGTLRVTAGGDALDSNGSLSVTGGQIGLWSATTMGEGAIDFNGVGSITGGTLIIASTGGVMRDTAALTGQPAMAIAVGSQAAGTRIDLTDGSGAVLGAFAPEMAYDTVVVSSDRLPDGGACAVICGGRQLFSGAMAGNLSGGGFGGFGGGWNGFDGGGKPGRRGR